jgi:elongation factor Ts
MVSLTLIKQLREATGVGVMDARKALEESGGNLEKARAWLSSHAVAKAAKKSDRSTEEGVIASYIHQTGKIGVLVKLGCETDFVARTDDFKNLGKEIAMQVASLNPKNTDELLSQEWIRDPKKTIKQLIDEQVAKMGENIKILEFVRMSF